MSTVEGDVGSFNNNNNNNNKSPQAKIINFASPN